MSYFFQDVIGTSDYDIFSFNDLKPEARPLCFDDEALLTKITIFAEDHAISKVAVILMLIKLYFNDIYISKKIKLPFKMNKFKDMVTPINLFDDHKVTLNDATIETTITFGKDPFSDHYMKIKRECWTKKNLLELKLNIM